MNTLVVYYSRTGHNQKMAQQLHKQLPGDIDQIVDLKKREGMFGCVMAAMLKAKTKIQFSKDPSAYDQVVVVTPLWGKHLPPATRTYLKQNRGKLNQLSFLSVCGLGEENTSARADFIATAQQQPVASLLLKETEIENEDSKQRRAEFIEQLPVREQ